MYCTCNNPRPVHGQTIWTRVSPCGLHLLVVLGEVHSLFLPEYKKNGRKVNKIIYPVTVVYSTVLTKWCFCVTASFGGISKIQITQNNWVPLLTVLTGISCTTKSSHSSMLTHFLNSRLMSGFGYALAEQMI